MTGIGIGCGVGLGGSRRMTPSQLHGRLSSIFGASLVGLWIGDDATLNGSNQYVTVLGRAGPTLTRHASSVSQIPATTINGRQFGGIAAGAVGFSATMASNVTSIGAVARTNNSVLGGKCIGRVVGASIPWVEGELASDAWRPFAGMTFSIDGAASVARTNGIHLFESSANVASNPTVYMFNNQTLNASFQCTSEVGLLYALSSAPSAPQSASTLAACRAYYGF